MKRIFILFFVIFANIAFGQLDDLFKKTIGNKDTWLPGKSITSSINDALPSITFLDYLKKVEPQVPADLLNLKPGYYRIDVESYCVKAGTDGPSKGDGYLIGPLLGKNADIVSSIIDKSVQHPNIEQHSIQVLLWAIEAGTKYDELSSDLKIKISPLLTPEDIVRLNVEVSDAINLLPADLVRLADFYNGMREKIKNPATTYEELEKIAVTNTGVPIDISDIRDRIDECKWSYIGDGYYMRAIPKNYYRTTLDILVIPKVNVTYDSKHRVTKMESSELTTEITYDDEQGRDILSSDGNDDLPIWRFKNLNFKGEGDEINLENTGWILKDGGKPIAGSRGKGVTLSTDNPKNTPAYSKYMDRLKQSKINNEQMVNSGKALKKIKSGGERESESEGLFNISDFDPQKDIHDGMDAATDPTDFKGKSKWFNNNLGNTLGAWRCAIDALAGGCSKEAPPKKPFQKFPALPTEPSHQRLVPSLRQYNG
ncbi:hypothetical protein BH10BAC5_BH10BAC5_07030 [soil metagenome]